MKTPVLAILFCLISPIVHCQINATVINSQTKEAVPFANIWVLNKNIGTSSGENGSFSLDCKSKDSLIKFTAIGFKSKTIKASLIDRVVYLDPQVTTLKKIVIANNPKSKRHERLIGKLKKRKINHYFSGRSKPIIAAKYFEYNETYQHTPYLKKVRLLTQSEVKKSKFLLKLYKVDKDHKPGELLCNKNIIGIAKKGKNVSEIDISKLGIEFPKEGLFMAIEWLIIASNKYEIDIEIYDTKKSTKMTRYAPMVGAIPETLNNKSWIYDRGDWNPVRVNSSIDKHLSGKRYRGKYTTVAFEVVLSN